jgi:enoyl-CoA hydratase/carnithine racemase
MPKPRRLQQKHKKAKGKHSVPNKKQLFSEHPIVSRLLSSGRRGFLVSFLVNHFEKAMVVFIIDMSKADAKNPLNPLGRKLRQLLIHNLDQAERDDTVTSVIITGGGKNFSAGADLTEFGSLDTTTAAIAGTSNGGSDEDEPSFSLIDVVERIENCSKPVVAAMSGVALGGGLEVALACHYRIAESTSSCGLPEVHVGVIPGAGGTQRLPRLLVYQLPWI